MSSDDRSIDSNDEFITELEELLRRAYQGGVDVEGGWVCRNGDSHPDWEAVIVEMSKPEGA
jgi:hypothetical protein